MFNVTDEFKALVAKPHVMASKVEVLEDGQVVTTLAPESGQVVVERANAIRRRAELTVADTTGTLTPVEATDLLHPLSGREFKVYRGLYHPAEWVDVDGNVRAASDPELPPLGVFRIKGASIKGTPNGVVIDLQGFDRARRAQRARLTDYHFIDYATSLGDALFDLLDPILPDGQAYSFPPESYDVALPALIFAPQDDRWERARKLARDSGFDLGFDPEAVLALRAILDASTVTPSVYYTEEEARPRALLEDERVVDDEGVFNHAVVTGGGPNTDATYRGDAADENPASPTYIGDPWGTSDFGDVPIFYQSEMIGSNDQAALAAAALLETRLGSLEQYSLTALVDASLDVYDVAVVTQSDTGADDRYVLDSITVGLGEEDSMALVTRRRRTPEEEA